MQNAVRGPLERLEIEIAPPPDARLTGTSPEFAISPDGRHVVFAVTSGGVSMLWVRSLETAALRKLSGTEGARSPFWKPNSRVVGFFASGLVKAVDLHGGSPVIICEAPPAETSGTSTLGGTWNTRDVVLFKRVNEPRLWRVEASRSGGRPQPLTSLTEQDIAHQWPVFLPDGERFLYLAQQSDKDELRVGSLGATATTSLGAFESHAAFAAGRLFFVRGGNLIAQPFDSETLGFRGDPSIVVTTVGVDAPWQRGMFSVSESGQLAFSEMARTPSQLTWFDRHGKAVGEVAKPGVFFNLDLSLDDRQIAISRMTERPGSKAQFDIWLLDLASAREVRLTDDPAWEFDPAWSHDGKAIAFNSNRPAPLKSRFRLFRRASNGTDEDRLRADVAGASAPDWSPDGRLVAFNAIGKESGSDLWTVRVSGDEPPAVFLGGRHIEEDPVFSPDGRWIAYTSNLSGREEVYVRPFPRREGLVFPVSRDGGWAPRWRADGKEMFFVSRDGVMMAVATDLTKEFQSGTPQPLFSTLLRPGNNRPYDVSRDGQRFLIPVLGSGAPITVVLNWQTARAR